MPQNNPVKKRLLDDCFLHDKDRIRHQDALSLLRERLTPICDVKQCNLAQASGKVLADNIVSPMDVPGHDNAAVDGYAFTHRDYLERKGQLKISDRIAAGDISPKTIGKNCAVRIFTGATVPAGADTVAMQEDCTVEGVSEVFVPEGLRKGANLRKAGEDLERESNILEKGNLIRPQDVAAIASVGIATMSVYAPLKVALFSSGNELRRPGATIKTGQVYDSNHFLLSSLLKPLPVEVTDMGILPDVKQQVENQIAAAANDFDVIITSGGASRGEEDHLVETMMHLGKCHVWQLAVKPGRPMSFGQISDTVMFGLPGNPVASFLCFLMYVRPAMLRLGGADWVEPARFPIPAGFAIEHKKPDRREFLRGTIETSENGKKVLQKFARDGSGLITGLRESSGFIEISEEITQVKPGDKLNFIPYSQFF